MQMAARRNSSQRSATPSNYALYVQESCREVSKGRWTALRSGARLQPAVTDLERLLGGKYLRDIFDGPNS